MPNNGKAIFEQTHSDSAGAGKNGQDFLEVEYRNMYKELLKFLPFLLQLYLWSY